MITSDNIHTTEILFIFISWQMFIKKTSWKQSHNPLKQLQFTITRSLIGQLHIDCPGNPPLLLHPTIKTIPVIVNTNVCSGRIIQDEPFYIVEINVNVSSAIDNGLKAHDLMFVYMAFVHIDDTSLDEDSIHHILNDVVPKIKFNDINTIIFNATNVTGYPGYS